MAKTPKNNKSTGRAYKGDKKYQSTTEQKKRRAARGRARYAAIKSGKARIGDGKDIHHKDGNPNNNKPSNTTSKSRASNRSFKRTKSAGKKNKKD